MFRPAYSSSIRAILPRARLSLSAVANFSSTSTVGEDQPNEPIDLDPSFKALLRDVDISLLKHKQNSHSVVVHPRPPPRELEAFDVELEEGEVREVVAGTVTEEREGEEDYHVGPRDARKSPAALFGSQSIGQVILPLELQNSINRLIAGVPPHISLFIYLPSTNYSTQNRIKQHSTATHSVSSHTNPPHPPPKAHQNANPKKPGKHPTISENINPPNRPQDTQ